MPDATGHRDRLKTRFTEGGGTGLADYELLELALTYAIPRKDVKPIAKELLKRFESLSGVLTAPAEELARIGGMGPHSATFLTLIHQMALRTQRRSLAEKPVFTNRVLLMDYLYTLFAGKTREELHVLYVDAKLALIKDETVFKGTLTATSASPRDIIKRALELNAAGLIITHNHPSGTPTPSDADHTFTTQLANLCPAMELALHDHLIIGADRHYSFKGAGEL
ncbi:MAG: DNA repair protein RadC [Pseudomonadaceae bacterium]|nr:DNA repair protein RadC [Pseudomonadaceae bacterium]